MHRNSYLPRSGRNSDTAVVFSDKDFPGWTFRRSEVNCQCFLPFFSLRMRRNGVVSTELTFSSPTEFDLLTLNARHSRDGSKGVVGRPLPQCDFWPPVAPMKFVIRHINCTCRIGKQGRLLFSFILPVRFWHHQLCRL